MGLDAVELILRAEEEFNITIEDSEAERVRTVGDFYQLILTKLDVWPDCQTSKAFFQTRRALVEALGVPRRSIRPGTELEELFPLEERSRLWNEVAGCMPLHFPQLKHARFWRSRFIMASMVLASIVVVTCWIEADRAWDLGEGLGSVVAATVVWVVLLTIIDRLLVRWTPFLRHEIPAGDAGELARVVMGMNPSVFTSTPENDKPQTEDMVWARLVEIFCDQLQIEPQEVIPRARIAEDLGVD